MRETERDEALIALLQPSERAEMEALVDRFVRTELPVISADTLHQAADLFEDRAVALQTAEGVSARVFVALLRARANTLKD
jgi:hypothetical protein